MTIDETISELRDAMSTGCSCTTALLCDRCDTLSDHGLIEELISEIERLRARVDVLERLNSTLSVKIPLDAIIEWLLRQNPTVYDAFDVVAEAIERGEHEVEP